MRRIASRPVRRMSGTGRRSVGILASLGAPSGHWPSIRAPFRPEISCDLAAASQALGSRHQFCLRTRRSPLAARPAGARQPPSTTAECALETALALRGGGGLMHACRAVTSRLSNGGRAVVAGLVPPGRGPVGSQVQRGLARFPRMRAGRPTRSAKCASRSPLRWAADAGLAAGAAWAAGRTRFPA